MTFFEIAVAAPIYNTLTYKAPSEDTVTIKPGHRVLVPLGKRLITGYCLKVEQSPPKHIQIKRINRVLDKEPLFPATMVPLFRWAASYYQHPIGEVVKSALPSGLTPQSGRKVILTALGKEHLTPTSYQPTDKDTLPPNWLCKLLNKEQLTSNEVRKIWKGKERKQLEEWQKQNFITIESAVSTDRVKKKKEVCIRFVSEFSENSWPDKLKISEKKTLDLLFSQIEQKKRDWIARKDITKVYSGARVAINSLHKQNILKIEEKQVYRDPFGESPPHFPKPSHLTTEQKIVLDTIIPAVKKQQYEPFLLHGVTGSGKTEVYLRAAEHTLAYHRSVLVLVPEIALANQLEGHFLSRFGKIVALLHSGLTSGEKFDQWHLILQGDAKIVIGARSAVFAPLQDLGLIIVDEEHDSAYKQDDGFRYNGRDMAVLRAQQQNAIVILGSATPSVTSYFHAQNNKYTLLEMPQRVANRKLPEVEIVDLRSVKTTSGRPPLFSPQLYQGLRENFKKGSQSLLFLNRRGYANMMICKDCGHAVQCSQCHVSLTLHQKKQALICHYCGYQIKDATICSNCKSSKIVPVGFGTEKIEEELKKLLPDAVIARMDQDTTRKRNEYMTILKAVLQQKIDILIGTQMIAKGHHFPNVTFVGVVWADAGLGIPDYRAGERTFQLLTQVFGRAGRGEKSGRVLVQTHYPSHYSILTSQHHDYLTLYNNEIDKRQKHTFPPYTRLINISFEGAKEQEVTNAAYFISQKAQKYVTTNITLLGPVPAPISKIRGMFRWQLLLKGTQVKLLIEVCRSLLQTKIPGMNQNAVKLSVDVDPENML